MGPVPYLWIQSTDSGLITRSVMATTSGGRAFTRPPPNIPSHLVRLSQMCQNGRRQLPKKQISSGRHANPHTPQLLSSWTTQPTPSQNTRFGPHSVQTPDPLQKGLSGGQTKPQLPQLPGSELTSMQAPSQHAS